MRKIAIEGTLKTPSVNLDYDNGLIEFSGRSTPENTEIFFRPVMEWAKEYISAPTPTTTISINFEYCNSSSIKYVVRLLELFVASKDALKNLTINWFYEDEETLESGKDIEDVIGWKFIFIQSNNYID